MTTQLDARTAKTKLKTQLGQHPALHGLGLTWDAQGNWVILVILIEGADTTDLAIPSAVNGVGVLVETRPRAVALQTNP